MWLKKEMDAAKRDSFDNYANCVSGTGTFAGVPLPVAVVQITQKSQAANGISPSEAGVRLLPLSLLAPVGAGFAGVFVSELQKRYQSRHLRSE
ncbi:MAG: hypothetical protein Q9175_005218 [Cornicularia normoerica]